MINWIKENKYKILVVVLVYLIVCVCVLGGFMTAWHFAEGWEQSGEYNNRLEATTSMWMTYALKPFTVIDTMFDGGTLQQNYLILCVGVFIAFIWMAVKLIMNSRKDHEYQGEEHGSSAWSKGGEEYRKLPDGSQILNKTDGFILSKNHYLGTDPKKVKVNKNILVFGGSGSGKSAAYVKPNILQKLGSYVITDPKGELYRETSGYLKANGYEVKVLNLVDTEYSNRYNPLAHIRDYSDVDIIAHTIVAGGEGDGGGKSADPFWDNTAKMLLKACIYYVISVLPEEERNLSSCLNIVRAGGSDESIFDRLFVGELKPDHPGRKEYEGIRVGADKTKQSIAISLVSKLSHFDSPNMQRLTTTNDIDFEDLGEKKVALYVISPDSHSTYNYILTIFYGQLLQRLYALADRCGGALHQPVYLLLDEFANIGKIPDFNQKLSTSRSRLISMSIIVQSIDQLVDLYKDLHENIIANCDTQLFLGSQSIKTCEYFSKSLGQTTLTFQNKSKNRDEKDTKTQGYSYSEQRQGRELMTIDELKRMPYDDMIILIRGLKPIYTKKAWYFKHHPERENAKRYEIKDITEMPKPEGAPIKTMDVEKHINDRLKRAREVANSVKTNNTDVEIDVGGSAITNAQQTVQAEATVDLQKELEKKFDELFGTNNNKPQE
ncbi:MAG: type IV secretory system conjugative DNA transfer family protein [Clostridia bacterium]|nr:type IV secretory system conjugative DNA transfer family protein [Clostridia bacterium]